MNTRVELTIIAAEKALKELIAEGKKISQYAIEKKAGLGNGALNYKHDSYLTFKTKIDTLKLNTETSSSIDIELKKKLVNESKLKDKYRIEKQKYKLRCLELEANNRELLYALFKTQKYLDFLEVKGLADSNVLNFDLNRFMSNKNS
tara:strand:+ start:1499 stop:1939 length:441 start_codon:yes stop_codon:yes gene_type:complete